MVALEEKGPGGRRKGLDWITRKVCFLEKSSSTRKLLAGRGGV